MIDNLFFHLSPISNNDKTGPIPVSTTSQNTCPPNCGLQKLGADGKREGFGCYVLGPVAWHWAKVSSGVRGILLAAFCALIRKMRPGTMWRHNQAGDLPPASATERNHLDAAAVNAIAEANIRRRGATYTHFPPDQYDNAEIIKSAVAKGFVINLSADNLQQADKYKALDIAPVTVILPHDQTKNLKTPAGNLVVVCPYELRKSDRQIAKPGDERLTENCIQCGLCWWAQRKVIIGFPAHGTQWKKAELVSIGGAE
jgi:hypothetical protein